MPNKLTQNLTPFLTIIPTLNTKS